MQWEEEICYEDETVGELFDTFENKLFNGKDVINFNKQVPFLSREELEYRFMSVYNANLAFKHEIQCMKRTLTGMRNRMAAAEKRWKRTAAARMLGAVEAGRPLIPPRAVTSQITPFLDLEETRASGHLGFLSDDNPADDTVRRNAVHDVVRPWLRYHPRNRYARAAFAAAMKVEEGNERIFALEVENRQLHRTTNFLAEQFRKSTRVVIVPGAGTLCNNVPMRAQQKRLHDIRDMYSEDVSILLKEEERLKEKIKVITRKRQLMADWIASLEMIQDDSHHSASKGNVPTHLQEVPSDLDFNINQIERSGELSHISESTLEESQEESSSSEGNSSMQSEVALMNKELGVPNGLPKATLTIHVDCLK